MPDLTALAGAGDMAGLENAWLEAAGSGSDPADAAGALRILLESGRNEEAVTLLELAIEEMERASNPALRAFVKACATLFDWSDVLRAQLLEQLRDEYLMYEPLEGFIRASGLSDKTRPLSRSWAHLTGLLRYQEGAWVLHESLGPGRITRINRSSATVDFESSRAHDMKLETLLSSSRPVSRDSARVLRRTDPKAFSALLSDPASLLDSLLAESGGVVRKADLSWMGHPQEIAELWKKIREAARSRPGAIEVGDEIRDSGSGNLARRILDALSSREPLMERNRVVSALLRSAGRAEAAEASLEVLERLPSRMHTVETGAMYELLWMLSGEPAGPAFSRDASGLVEKTPSRVARALGEIGTGACRRIYLEEAVAVLGPEGARELMGVLPRSLWQYALDVLSQASPETGQAYIESLLSDRSDVELHLRAVESLLHSAEPGGEPEGRLIGLVLDSLPRARADTQRRLAQTLVERHGEALALFLERLDTRRLEAYSTQVADIGSAHDTGLFLVVLSALSARKGSTGRHMHFWEGGTIFDSADAITSRRRAIETLKTVELPAVARAIGEAASHGDLSENAEHKAAIEKRDLILDRIRSWTEQLERTRPYPINDVKSSITSPGTRVTLRAPDGSMRVISLVGPIDARPEADRVNYLAPLGAALLGLGTGDSALLPGTDVEMTVERIEILPEVMKD
ncbi:hypothetical protein GX411_10880 [Candidatus Fermentibacteria bacterium]|nr:hypothetical protein [Candidatus Fermentibacteria bacterium]